LVGGHYLTPVNWHLTASETWTFAAELPRSAAGKLLRRKVRESVAPPVL